ncbi:MAG: heme-binding protein [Actinomycetota bacterium]|nr:heme-binding protein [Actinomycetota bacterium]
MDVNAGFIFQPTTPVVGTSLPATTGGAVAPPPAAPSAELGQLAGLLGNWQGKGFNTIWLPRQPATGSDQFLELNLTDETLSFDPVPGDIPNRGLLQGDIRMAGLHYLQQISDANVIDSSTQKNAGLHFEPGLWLAVPATTDPVVPQSVARLASIPHGTTIVAQGLMTTNAGGPAIPSVSITPFVIGNPQSTVGFPEQTLTATTSFRTAGAGLTNIGQPMLDNPNSVLTTVAGAVNVATTTTLSVSSFSTPILGGGTANTAFLQGGPNGPNADTARVDATFWLQTTEGAASPDLLQYSQTVLLNFKGLSWPHVTVATLRRVP